MYIVNDRSQALTLTILLLIIFTSTLAAAVPQAAAEPTVTVGKASYTIGESVSLSGTAPPNSLISIQVFNPAGVREAIAQASADGEGRYSVFNLYMVKAGDPAGVWTVKVYQGGVSATATFEVVPVDVTPPSLSVSIMPRKRLYKVEEVSILISADENLGKCTVQVTQRDAATKEAPPTPVVLVDLRKWSATYTVTSGYDGPATIEISATDLAGNQATATASFNVDTTPPTVTLKASERTEEAEVEVSGTVDDPAIMAVGLSVAGLSPKTVPVSEGRWTAKLTLPATGTNIITVRAVDEAGNEGTASAVTVYVAAIDVIADRVKSIEQHMAGLEEKVESGLAESRATSEKSLADTRSAVAAEMADTRSAVKGEMEETRSTIEGKMADTQAEITTLGENLRGEMSTLSTLILIAVILSLVAAAFAIASVITITRRIVLK